MGLADELQEAIGKLDEAPEGTDPWTDEEMAAFLEEHPMITVLVAEGFDPDEVIEAMEAGMATLMEKGKGPGESGKEGNKGNDPFATAPLHPTSSYGKGGGDPKYKKKGPYTRTGECVNCSCDGGVCKCTCNGKPRTINMKKYYDSGRKARYMDDWRVNHGVVHPR